MPQPTPEAEAGFVKAKAKSKTLTTKRSQSELRPKTQARPVAMKRSATSSYDEITNTKSKDKKEKEKQGTSLDTVSADTDLDVLAKDNVLQSSTSLDEYDTTQMQPNDIQSKADSKEPLKKPKKDLVIDLAATESFKPTGISIKSRNSSYDDSRSRMIGSKTSSLDIDETKEMEFSHLPLPETKEEKAARLLYEEVAKDIYNTGGYKTTTDGKLPSRGPFTCGRKLSRGTHFYDKFKHFVESGGIAKHKNCVVMNIRLNDIRDIQSANGSGTFKVNFFLDTAFWVPIWDYSHFASQNTVGQFTQYEPLLMFPEVDADSGFLRWGIRTAEFSKDFGKSRHHEVQIGQNFESFVLSDAAMKDPIQALLNRSANASGSKVNNQESLASLKKLSVVDDCSHWPRLWRVCVSDSELQQIKALDSHSKRLLEPTNENPTKCHERLTDLFKRLDRDREQNLSLSTEGIGFVTYEISCTHRNEFSLQEFPFDMHSLKIVVRLDQKDKDPLQRVIVPLGHDKAFFISSRVSELVDYHLAQNLDWEVTKEPVSLGGNQRLNASAIVRRKPGYYIRNYVVIIFLLSSASFTSFIARPDDYETRSMIIFTLLLSVVAFKYSGDDLLPSVSYPTTLDAFILLNFYVVLVVGVVTFGFSTVCSMSGVRSDNKQKVEHDYLCSNEPGRWYGMEFIPAYGPVFESSVGVFLFILWISANIWYWLKVYNRIKFNVLIINRVDLGWMRHKHMGGGKKGHYQSDKLVTHKKKGGAYL